GPGRDRGRGQEAGGAGRQAVQGGGGFVPGDAQGADQPPGRGDRLGASPGQVTRRSKSEIRISKSEIRISKSETNPKSEGRKSETERSGFGHSDFGIRICFGFRYSDFPEDSANQIPGTVGPFS